MYIFGFMFEILLKWEDMVSEIQGRGVTWTQLGLLLEGAGYVGVGVGVNVLKEKENRAVRWELVCEESK